MSETFKEQCNTGHMIMDAEARSGRTAGVEISQTNSTFADNDVTVRAMYRKQSSNRVWLSVWMWVYLYFSI
jgi:hypothetical protein